MSCKKSIVTQLLVLYGLPDIIERHSFILRRDLARNLVIVGGTSMLVGFKARLFEELRHLLKESPQYKDKLSIGETC